MSGEQLAAVYTRVSSSGQEDGASLPTQQAECERYATEQGYTVAGVYSDVFTGASLWERPNLSRLRDAVRRQEVGAVIVYALDRLSRKQAHISIIAEECERAGVALLFATEEFERSSVGEFIRSAKAFAAELEREKIAERTQRGRLAKMQSGRLNGNTPVPFGFQYSADKTRYVEHPTEAATVRRIFALAASGASLRGIGRTLNSEGIASPGGTSHWAATSVRKILVNRSYTGVVIQRMTKTTKAMVDGRLKRVTVVRPEAEWIVTPGLAPALIDEATFAAVQGRLSRNAMESTRNCKRPELFLLRGGFIRDGRTGRALMADGGNREDGRWPIYRHRLFRPDANDAPYALDGPETDAKVWGLVRLILGNPGILTMGMAGAGNAGPSANEEATRAALAKTTRQQQNIVKMAGLVEDEDTRAALAAQLEQLAAQRKSLEAELQAAAQQEEARRAWAARLDILRGMGAEFARVADSLSYEEKRDWLRALGLVVLARREGEQTTFVVRVAIPLPDGGFARTFAYTSTDTPCTPRSRRTPPSSAATDSCAGRAAP